MDALASRASQSRGIEFRSSGSVPLEVWIETWIPRWREGALDTLITFLHRSTEYIVNMDPMYVHKNTGWGIIDCTLGNDVTDVHGMRHVPPCSCWWAVGSNDRYVFVSEQASAVAWLFVDDTTYCIYNAFFFSILVEKYDPNAKTHRKDLLPSIPSRVLLRPTPANGNRTALFHIDDPTALANRGPQHRSLGFEGKQHQHQQQP